MPAPPEQSDPAIVRTLIHCLSYPSFQRQLRDATRIDLNRSVRVNRERCVAVILYVRDRCDCRAVQVNLRARRIRDDLDLHRFLLRARQKGFPTGNAGVFHTDRKTEQFARKGCILCGKRNAAGLGGQRLRKMFYRKIAIRTLRDN